MAVELDRNRMLVTDGRQSQMALDIQRGVGRMLSCMDMAFVSELDLGGGGRSDLVGLSRNGEIWIIEIKSSLADFRCDRKWSGYKDYCDRFYFAVEDRALLEIMPDEEGLILADRYGAEIVREAQSITLTAPRRKAMTIRFGRAAARKLHGLLDPEFDCFG